MSDYEVSREGLMEELARDLESGRKLSGSCHTVRANKPMNKKEFSDIRGSLDLTQARLAEILDISIKSVQAYEQGRTDVPGLVAKVMRLMSSDSVFRSLFKGEMSEGQYSEYATVRKLVLINQGRHSMYQLAESITNTLEELDRAEVESLTDISDFRSEPSCS
jgi:DNA-binding transcriptional regulator YiaG